MKFKLLFIVIAMLLLCGCGTILTEGEVYDKQFIESHSEVTAFPATVPSVNAATGQITTDVKTVPHICYYSDAYAIYIRAFRDNEWVTAVYYVPEDVYNSVNIGDTFKYEEGRDRTTIPHSTPVRIG